METSGHCNCKTVSCIIKGLEKNVVNCHCEFCRRMNGASFSTYVIIANENFAITSGQANINSYSVSPNATKFFCNICGTPIYNSNPKYEGLKIVYLGFLDNAKQYTPKINIFCDTKLNWLDEIFNRKNFNQSAT